MLSDTESIAFTEIVPDGVNRAVHPAPGTDQRSGAVLHALFVRCDQAIGRPAEPDPRMRFVRSDIGIVINVAGWCSRSRGLF